MPKFIVAKNIYSIPALPNMYDSIKFNCKDRLVNRQGKTVGSTYVGYCYRLVAKKERAYSTIERLGRGALGALAVFFSCGLTLFLKNVRHLFDSKYKIRFAILHKVEPKEPANVDELKVNYQRFLKDNKESSPFLVSALEKAIDLAVSPIRDTSSNSTFESTIDLTKKFLVKEIQLSHRMLAILEEEEIKKLIENKDLTQIHEIIQQRKEAFLDNSVCLTRLDWLVISDQFQTNPSEIISNLNAKIKECNFVLRFLNKEFPSLNK